MASAGTFHQVAVLNYIIFPHVMKYHLPFIEFLETNNLRLKDTSFMPALNLVTFNIFMDFVNRS